MQQMVSTQQVEPAQRLAFWTDMVCNTRAQLDCDAAAGEASIEGGIAAATLASLQRSCVTATAQPVRRTPAQIAQASAGRFLVSIQSQDDRVARLQPGDFALRDSTRPRALRFAGPFQQYVLGLPGPTLHTALRPTSSSTAGTGSGQRGAGHLLSTMVRTPATDIDLVAPESAHALAARTACRAAGARHPARHRAARGRQRDEQVPAARGRATSPWAM